MNDFKDNLKRLGKVLQELVEPLARQTTTCPECGSSNPLDNKFCAHCSYKLAAFDEVGIITEIRQGQSRNLAFGGYLWRVLEVQEDRALLLTEDVVEKRPYNTQSHNITWETCTLRQYLNSEFYKRFSPQEQAKILAVDNFNQNNPWYGIKGGDLTKDKVFLLSINEVIEYFGDSGKLRRAKGFFARGGGWLKDDFNHKRIAKYNDRVCWWWLRSMGARDRCAAYVGRVGDLSIAGLSVHGGGVFAGVPGVRPALWLDLQS